MLKESAIRKPDAAEDPPSRILPGNGIEIGSEHQPPNNECNRCDTRKCDVPGQKVNARKSCRGEKKCDRIMCLSAWHGFCQRLLNMARLMGKGYREPHSQSP